MADDERTHAEMTAAFEEKAAALEERTATIRRELFRRDLEHEHALEPGRLPDLEDEGELRHEAERIAANDQLRVRVRPRRRSRSSVRPRDSRPARPSRTRTTGPRT